MAVEIEVPAESSLGPKMNALTELQRKFVIAVMELGDNDYTRAAKAAGYAAPNQNVIRVTAHHLAHNERVLAAMHEEAERRMNAGKLIAVQNLLLISTNPQHKDQFKAVTEILNRTGLHAKSEHTVKVRDESRTDEAMVERVRQLAQSMHYSQEETQKLLASAGVIDAEFTVLPQSEEWEDE